MPLARVERAAHGLGIRCSILLSYRGSGFYDVFNFDCKRFVKRISPQNLYFLPVINKLLLFHK
jgi:hypothetical protein